jgi:calcineurin-like phosphoesterase family protein
MFKHNTFLIGDLHFGHKNIIKFKDKNKKLIRPFESIEDHDFALINNWNNVVNPNGDKVLISLMK